MGLFLSEPEGPALKLVREQLIGARPGCKFFDGARNVRDGPASGACHDGRDEAWHGRTGRRTARVTMGVMISFKLYEIDSLDLIDVWRALSQSLWLGVGVHWTAHNTNQAPIRSKLSYHSDGARSIRVNHSTFLRAAPLVRVKSQIHSQKHRMSESSICSIR